MIIRIAIPLSLRALLVAGAVMLAGLEAGATTYYVTPNGFDKGAGTNWATAKLSIQAAVDAATNGDLVLVTNGVYAKGATPYGYLTNRVTITKPITVQSVNGPQFTIITGTQVPGSLNGDSAIRCAYVGSGAILSGFTLTGGATLVDDNASYTSYDLAGGGVLCDGTVQNCIITGNSGLMAGGARVNGSLNSCIISNNVATGFYAPAYGFQEGPGGVSSGALNNCLVVNNRGGEAGACAEDCYLLNCTVTGNVSTNTAAVNSTLVNCIVYYNTNYSNPNTRQIATNCDVSYTCTTPLPAGTGNFTNPPIFVSSSNFRLGPYSPCADAGNNNAIPGLTDLDGQPRLFRKIDLGCYERQIPGDLNNDGVVDINDLNGLLANYSSNVDQTAVSAVLSNYWPNHLLLNLTNVAGLGGTNITFTLTNSNAGSYSVQYSTNFTTWQTLGPAVPCYIFTDTNAASGPQRFYRLSFP